MADPLPDTDDSPAMPRWVKISLVLGGVIVLLLGVMLLSGHGPQRHMSMNHTMEMSP